MSYLNWKTQPNVTITRAIHPKYQTQLSISADHASLKELAAQLTQTLLEAKGDQANAEVKLDLEQTENNSIEKWTLYFKIKIGQDRMTVAHPQLNEWVASLTLSRTHTERMIEAITKLSAGESIALGGSTKLAVLSNFELVLVCN